MGEANTARHDFKDIGPVNWQGVDKQTVLWMGDWQDEAVRAAIEEHNLNAQVGPRGRMGGMGAMADSKWQIADKGRSAVGRPVGGSMGGTTTAKLKSVWRLSARFW